MTAIENKTDLHELANAIVSRIVKSNSNVFQSENAELRKYICLKLLVYIAFNLYNQKVSGQVKEFVGWIIESCEEINCDENTREQLFPGQDVTGV